MDLITDNFGSILTAVVSIGSGLLIIFAQFYNYQNSDGLMKLLNSSSTERFISFLFKKIRNALISCFIVILFWLYIATSENDGFKKFISELDTNDEFRTTLILISMVLWIMFTYFIEVFSREFPFSENKSLKVINSSFYIDSCDLPEITDILDGKIYIIDKIDKDTILCSYVSNKSNEMVRVLLSYETLINKKIHAEKKVGFFQVYLEVNRTIKTLSQMQILGFFLIYCIPAMLVGLLSLLKKDYSTLIGFSGFYFGTLIAMFLPAILSPVINFFKKRMNRKAKTSNKSSS